jgi:hypothetical protein
MFLLSTTSERNLGPTQLPIKWVLGVLSPGLNDRGMKFNDLSPSSADVKNNGAIPPIPVRLHAVVNSIYNYVTDLNLPTALWPWRQFLPRSCTTDQGK